MARAILGAARDAKLVPSKSASSRVVPELKARAPMHGPRRTLAMLVLSLVVAIGSQGVSAQPSSEREPLRRLGGMAVIVEDFPDAVEQKGLSRAKIQDMVEQKLKGAGVTVLPSEAWLNTPGTPALYLSVNINSSQIQGLYACSINVCLAQRAILERDPSIRTFARTWQVSTVGLVKDREFPGIQEQVAFLVDHFVSEYFAVNPKAEPPAPKTAPPPEM